MGRGEWRRGGDVRYSLGKFFKEVEFKVDLEGNFVVLEAEVTKTIPFRRIGEKGKGLLFRENRLILGIVKRSLFLSS